ncbi:MAG: hypothetical protein PWR30_525 [Candidatus Woesearchaeota archaeon]|nr:hypothetical protein [Candidatus Woesearchaeota archaeon]
MKIGNKIKTGILIGAAFASQLFAQKAYSAIIQQPTAQYQTMEQAGEEAGEDGEFSLEEIIKNLPEENVLNITPFAFNKEELREYYSGLGLDLEAKNEEAIKNLLEVTLPHYNSITKDINQLNNQTAMILEKIESDDQAKTAYSVIEENLSQLESLAQDVRRSSFELNDLSELIVATYHASKSISEEDAEKLVDLAKTIYSKAENAPFGLKHYDSSMLKEANDAVQKIIEVYEKEEKRLEEKLKEAEKDYLVKTRAEIEEEKNEINNLIMRAKETQETFNEISENYNSSILTLERVAKNSTNVINVHNVMKTHDKDYNDEKKANISAVLVPTISYSNNSDPNVSWSLYKLSPSAELEAKIPYSPNDLVALLIGGKFVYEEENLLRKTDVAEKHVYTENTAGGVSGKLVFKPAKDSNLYLILGGNYLIGNRIEEITGESPVPFRVLNEESVSKLGYEIGLSGVLNKENGLLAGISIAGENSKEGMNEESNQYLLFHLNNHDHSDSINGGLKLGFGTTTERQIELNEESKDKYLLLGANTNFEVFGIPSDLEFLLRKSGSESNVKLEMSNDVTDNLRLIYGINYIKNGDDESKTKIGVGISTSF